MLIAVTCFAQENLQIKRIKLKGESAAHNSMVKESMTLKSTSWFKRKILKKDAVLYTNKLYHDDISKIKQQYQKNGYLKISFGEPVVTVNKKQKINLLCL